MLQNWDQPEGFPEDVNSMCSSLSFDYLQSPGYLTRQLEMQGLHGEGDENDSLDSEDQGGKIMLPIGHRQIHLQAQRSVQKQKTLVLRRAHYQEYPYFHKREDTVIRDPVCVPPVRTLLGLPPAKTSGVPVMDRAQPRTSTPGGTEWGLSPPRRLNAIEESRHMSSHFAFNDHQLSPGEKVLSLRQVRIIFILVWPFL